jgi:thiol-disulfide isomerase/thioredoxin
VLAVSLMLALSLHAQDPAPRPTLVVGDDAPALEIASWVKGAPVGAFERGQIYVLEFWYVWCGPCVAGMPHLTKVQAQHAKDGVHVVGVTSLDRFGSTLESVKALVARKGDAIGYSIGVDADDAGAKPYLGVFAGKTVSRYLAAAAIPSVPCAVVVDRGGKVAWIGHPLSLDRPLAEIVAGRYDLRAKAAEYLAVRGAEPKLARLQEAAKSGDRAETARLARELASGPLAADARGLQAIAEALCAAKVEADADRALALDAATRAVDLTESGDPGMLNTLAHAHALRGEIDLAIAAQRKAVEISEGDARAAEEAELRKQEALRKPD